MKRGKQIVKMLTVRRKKCRNNNKYPFIIILFTSLTILVSKFAQINLQTE